MEDRVLFRTTINIVELLSLLFRECRFGFHSKCRRSSVNQMILAAIYRSWIIGHNMVRKLTATTLEASTFNIGINVSRTTVLGLLRGVALFLIDLIYQ